MFICYIRKWRLFGKTYGLAVLPSDCPGDCLMRLSCCLLCWIIWLYMSCIDVVHVWLSTVKNSELSGQTPQNPCVIQKLKSCGRKFASFARASFIVWRTVCYGKNIGSVHFFCTLFFCRKGLTTLRRRPYGVATRPPSSFNNGPVVES